MRIQGKVAAMLLPLMLLPLMLPHRATAGSASKAEVLAAIHAAMESRGYAFPKGVCSQELELNVTIPEGSGAGLMVASMKFDSGLGQARFLLRSRGNRKAPPFYAWCTFAGTAGVRTSALEGRETARAGAEESALGPVLVDVHRAANLYLHSEHSATVMRVRVLQNGHKGERIRVRLPLHGKTVEARVVGEDAVEATF
jgi:Chaperone for flagella basal body P-ring formation